MVKKVRFIRKSYYISRESAERLVELAKAAKRNASQQLDWILSTQGEKNGKAK